MLESRVISKDFIKISFNTTKFLVYILLHFLHASIHQHLLKVCPLWKFSFFGCENTNEEVLDLFALISALKAVSCVPLSPTLPVILKTEVFWSNEVNLS